MRHAITNTPTQVTIRLMAKSRSIGHLPRYSVEYVGVFGFELREPLDSFAGLELPHQFATARGALRLVPGGSLVLSVWLIKASSGGAGEICRGR